METVKRRQHGSTYKGHTIPYGTLAYASQELISAYYTHGYKEDSMMPEIPRPPYEHRECHDPEEEVHKKEMVRVVEDVLDTLTPRSKKVLCLRYGIGLTQDYTLEEVGTRFDVTRERIRQIEVKALRHMKHPQRSDVLRQLIGYYVSTAEKKAEEESAKTRWEKERARAEEQREARAQAKIARDHAIFKQRREVEERMYKADRELRKKWDELKPMVSDVEWVQHLKAENPDMYQELKYLVGDIWGNNAKIVWEMYAEKEKRK
jgi:DNA-directed RNA polymerase specialized sigma24 family protein